MHQPLIQWQQQRLFFYYYEVYGFLGGLRIKYMVKSDNVYRGLE
jgi:hypothetical protein